MPKQLLFSETARRKMMEGVDILAHAVGSTLGPTGRNVILSKSFGGPTVTKDGVTVSKEIELSDPFENMGAKLVNVVASKTSDVAGDGTTTATILARAILSRGAQEHHVGRQSDRGSPGHRKGCRGRRRRADQQGVAAGVEEGRDCPGRVDLGEQRSDDRRHACGCGRTGRPRRRDHGRGGQDSDHGARVCRGNAV